MKVISLWQPWATLVALGLKRNETRSWATDYRGPLAIHAAKLRDRDSRDFYTEVLLYDQRFADVLRKHGYYTFDGLPFGAVVCTTILAGCRPAEQCTDLSDMERLVGGYAPGRFAWTLANVERIEPVPVVGRQGFFWWERAA